MNINNLFNLLDDWRHLPAYQLERRADIFFALYLEQIIHHKNGVRIDYIIPEFPVRVGEISEKYAKINQSFKIDYLAYAKKEECVFLIELKTDQRSRRDKQDWYLQRAAEIGVDGILQGLQKIYKATNQKVKYKYLLTKIEQMGWITQTAKSFEINPTNTTPEIIYIQPRNPESLCNVISFDDIITALANQQDEMAVRFRESLGRWR